jgi:hypothetical protein
LADITQTERTRLRRVPNRGVFERDAINAILDAGVMCHVGYLVDGKPVVTPTLYWREGERIYWHGSSASRMLRAVAGADVCLTVSHLDGLVLARSGFHHSVDYRSVMLFGRAEVVTDSEEVAGRLQNFVDGLFPGRWAALRPPNAQELKATQVLSMPIDEASAKVRDHGVVDEEEDYDWPVWAGVIPVRTVVGEPQPDPRLMPGIDAPEHVTAFRLGETADGE